MRRWCSWLALAVLGTLAACASEPFPESLEGYATSEECVLLNLDAVPPHDEVPHPGYKSIYACHETPELFFDGETWVGPPYPDGTLIVKESCMDGACGEFEDDFVFLVATAEKKAGAWEWNEYTRNFENEDLLEVPFPESACIDCHRDVEAADWMFTGYQSR